MKRMLRLVRAATPALILWALFSWSFQSGGLRTRKVTRNITDKAHLITCGRTSKGSGFFIDEQRFFTAYHVIEPCAIGDIQIAGSLPALRYEMADATRDAAVIIVETGAYRPPIVDLSCDLPEDNSRVVMTGFALSSKERMKAVDGKVVMPYWFGQGDTASLAKGRPLLENNAIVEGEIFAGMSGGPVFYRDTGRVFGWTSYSAQPLPELKYTGVGLFFDVCGTLIQHNRAALERLEGGP